MTGELPRRFGIGGSMYFNFHLAGNAFNFLEPQSTRPVNNSVIVVETDDGRLNADVTGTAIEDVRYIISQLILNMLWCRRTNISKRIGTGCCQREVQRFKKAACKRMIGTTEARSGQPGGYQIGDFGLFFEHKGKRTRPERIGQLLRLRGNITTIGLHLLNGRHMHDERIENGSVLHLKDLCDSLCTQGIAREAVNRLCGDGHKFSRGKELPCFIYIFTDLSHVLAKVKLMTRILLCLILTTGLFFSVSGQNEDRVLRGKLESLVRDFEGDVGIYVQHIPSGKTVTIHADTVFPTASMIKVPITIGMFNKIEAGEIAYDSVLVYRDSLLYAGEDILGSFKDGEKIALSKVMMLMITTSDNTASLWCQHLAGTGVAINQWLEAQGYRHTRMNSRTPGRRDDWERYGWGQTTPREMAGLLLSIRNGEVISERASERIYRNLIRIYWDSQSLSQIPPFVQVASKSGSVDASRSEVVLVNAPHGDYVFCVITKNQRDQSWNSNNEGYVLLRKVSRLLWNHFEPKSKWKPAKKIEEWY